MELDDRNRLIAGLEQAPMSGGGADLALSICGQLIREMGGTITVGDSAGQGTRIFFAIPFDIAADAPARQPEQLEKLAGKRVMVVDDNATTREIFLQSFADWSIEAEGAEDGPSALESLKQADEQATPFHVAVVDMSMPDMTGIELARAIRSEPSLQHLCLVLLTTTDVPVEEFETSETAVSARIEKPVHGVALLDQVISAIIEAPAIQRDVPAESATTPDVESEAEPGPGNELAEKYLRHTLISLEKLRDAVASEKAGAVQMTADSLKSSSLDIGATALAGLCRELESMARVGNLGGVHSMLDSIEQEYAKVCETLRTELSMDAPPSEEADPPPPPSS